MILYQPVHTSSACESKRTAIVYKDHLVLKYNENKINQSQLKNMRLMDGVTRCSVVLYDPRKKKFVIVK